MKKVNLACGTIVLDGWDNLDYEQRVDGVINCDLTKRLPYETGSVGEILTSHFLEHLKLRTQAVPFLAECARVLQPGGLLSIIVPDFEVLTKIKRYDYHFGTFRKKKEQLRWLVGATYGEGRTPWDYHVSGWFKERFRELGNGIIVVDTAAGDPVNVWVDDLTGQSQMTLERIIPKWRPHSPYEITAIYRKAGGVGGNDVTWLNEPKVVGQGMVNPWVYTLKKFPKMVRNFLIKSL
ncbi:MAG: methyltransferase domain-containing protein [Planctomycetaceae bacterium]|nr:methyltransferase domain-containing protein [Planctomycetaceae bacterium]